MPQPNVTKTLASTLILIALTVPANSRLNPIRANDHPAPAPQQTPGSPNLADHPADQGQRVGVAALVLPNVRGDRPKALARIEAYTRRAAALGAKIVVTPEACLDGYCCHTKGLTPDEFRNRAEHADSGPSIRRLRELARELDLYLCLGFTELDGDKLFNTALLIGPDGATAGKFRKTHGVENFYTPGDELPVFDTRYDKIGMLICYDRQLPETARTLAQRGAELILIPSNGMWGGVNDPMMRTRAYENGLHLVFAHPRDGLVIDPGGRIIAANLTVPGSSVGLHEYANSNRTDDAGGWPEAVVREIDLAAWRGMNKPFTNLRREVFEEAAGK